METSAYYTRVGLFVVIFFIIMVLGSLWLTVGLSGKSYHDYLVFIKESVSGLTQKAPVKYNGVKIGYVNDISLDRHDPQKVRLLLAIETDVPIYQGTKAVLETQGLTGVAYIELKGGDASLGLLKAKRHERYPVLQSAPSLLFRLDSAVDDLTKNIENISNSTQQLLSENNIQLVHNILNNFSAISNDIVAHRDQINDIIKNTNVTVKNTAIASGKLPEIFANINQSTQSLDKVSQELTAVTIKANKLLQNGQVTMEVFNTQLLPEIITAVSNLQSIISSGQMISSEIAENPAILIRGKNPQSEGPGE